MIFPAFVVLLGCLLGLSQALGPYKISTVSVSGLSSGAYMAVQMHIAYSSIINGSAIFAGGPWYCAEANLFNAEYKCMATSLGTPDVAKLVSLTTTDAVAGLVDQTTFLADDRVYLFSGAKDSVIAEPVMKALQTYYQSFVKIQNIVADYNFPAEHCMPTLSFGEACTTLASPYLGKCNLDSAGVALQVLYGEGIQKGVAVAANLKSFDQKPFIKGTGTSLGDTGYVYVPSSCAAGTVCRLHVSFHGCLQTVENIGNSYALNSGYNAWAEANDIIVLYPYAKPSSSLPSNPNGCWDWWAYTDKNYCRKTGVQMSFVKRIIDDVTGGSLTPTTTPTASTTPQPSPMPATTTPTALPPTVYPTQATPTTDANAPTMFPTDPHPTLFPISPTMYPTAVPPTMYPTDATPTLKGQQLRG